MSNFIFESFNDFLFFEKLFEATTLNKLGLPQDMIKMIYTKPTHHSKELPKLGIFRKGGYPMAVPHQYDTPLADIKVPDKPDKIITLEKTGRDPYSEHTQTSAYEDIAWLLISVLKVNKANSMLITCPEKDIYLYLYYKAYTPDKPAGSQQRVGHSIAMMAWDQERGKVIDLGFSELTGLGVEDERIRGAHSLKGGQTVGKIQEAIKSLIKENKGHNYYIYKLHEVEEEDIPGAVDGDTIKINYDEQLTGVKLTPGQQKKYDRTKLIYDNVDIEFLGFSEVDKQALVQVKDIDHQLFIDEARLKGVKIFENPANDDFYSIEINGKVVQPAGVDRINSRPSNAFRVYILEAGDETRTMRKERAEDIYSRKKIKGESAYGGTVAPIIDIIADKMILFKDRGSQQIQDKLQYIINEVNNIPDRDIEVTKIKMTQKVSNLANELGVSPDKLYLYLFTKIRDFRSEIYKGGKFREEFKSEYELGDYSLFNDNKLIIIDPLLFSKYRISDSGKGIQRRYGGFAIQFGEKYLYDIEYDIEYPEGYETEVDQRVRDEMDAEREAAGKKPIKVYTELERMIPKSGEYASIPALIDAHTIEGMINMIIEYILFNRLSSKRLINVFGKTKKELESDIQQTKAPSFDEFTATDSEEVDKPADSKDDKDEGEDYSWIDTLM